MDKAIEKNLKKQMRVAVLHEDGRYYLGEITKLGMKSRLMSIAYDDGNVGDELKFDEVDLFDGNVGTKIYKKGLRSDNMKKFAKKYGNSVQEHVETKPAPASASAPDSGKKAKKAKADAPAEDVKKENKAKKGKKAKTKSVDSTDSKEQTTKTDAVKIAYKKNSSVVIAIGNNFYTGSIQKFLDKKDMAVIELDAMDNQFICPVSDIAGFASKPIKKKIPADKIVKVMEPSSFEAFTIKQAENPLVNAVISLSKGDMRKLLKDCADRSSKFSDVLK